MAIYKNREVSVMSPNHSTQPPTMIVVQYKDGTHETVSLSGVKFTEDEKKALIKSFPSQFDAVSTVSEDDLKAVRLGVTPPSDPDLKAQAEERVRRQKMEEETRKNMEKYDSEAKKKVDAQVNQSQPAPATVAKAK